MASYFRATIIKWWTLGSIVTGNLMIAVLALKYLQGKPLIMAQDSNFLHVVWALVALSGVGAYLISLGWQKWQPGK